MASQHERLAEREKEWEKTRDRIGRNASQAMNWVVRFAQLQLYELSAGDLINVTAEVDMFAQWGVGFSNSGAIVEELAHDNPSGRIIPPLGIVEMRRLQAFTLQKLDTLAKDHFASFDFDSFRLIARSIPDKDFSATIPIVGTRKEGFAYHLAQLIGEHAHRIGKCAECNRLFVGIRLHQKFCSSRCRSRVGTREFRKSHAQGTRTKRIATRKA